MIINTKIDISSIVGFVLGRTLIFKNVEPFTENEFKEFMEELKKDEEFLDICKGIVK